MKMEKGTFTQNRPSNAKKVLKKERGETKSSVRRRNVFRKKNRVTVGDGKNIPLQPKVEPSNWVKNGNGEKANPKKDVAQVKQKKGKKLKHNKNTASQRRDEVADSRSANDSSVKNTVRSDIPQKEPEKAKRLQSIRQLHKHKKQAEKRKAMRAKKMELKNIKKLSNSNAPVDESSEKSSEQKPSSEKEKQGRIILPKSVIEATSNWRQLQMAMKSGKRSSKRKSLDPLQIRNPKYQKLDEKTRAERVIAKVTETKRHAKSPEIWFDDVDEFFIDKGQKETIVTDAEDTIKNGERTPETDNELVKPESYKGLTNFIGMDCEMVGIKDGNASILGRVSIVNRYGEKIYDKFVKPTQKVTDYRTHVSGIRPEDMEKGEPFKKVRSEVAKLLRGRILIGHALKNDFKALNLRHPPEDTRDTSMFPTFRQMFSGKTPGLRKLTEKVLSVKIQRGEHNSIQDAQAAVRLYTMYKTQWEADIKKKGKKKKKKKIIKTLDKTDQSDKLEVVNRLWNV